MVRPGVGADPRRCAECSGYEYGGAPACAACRALVDGIVEDAWAAFTRRWDVAHDQEAALAEMVAAEPDRHDWRVVDAALDRLHCARCGDRHPLGPRLPLRGDRDGPARRSEGQRTRRPGQRLRPPQAARHLGERTPRPAGAVAPPPGRIPADRPGSPADERPDQERHSGAGHPARRAGDRGRGGAAAHRPPSSRAGRQLSRVPPSRLPDVHHARPRGRRVRYVVGIVLVP